MSHLFSFDFEKYIKPYQHIIWDWNGTLLDDVELCFSVLCELLTENNLPVPDLDRYLKTFRFPIKDYYEEFGFDFNSTSFEFIAERFMEIYNNKVKSSSLFNGTHDWLELVRNKQKEQSILSAASQDHLNEIIQHFKIEHLFDRIFGIENNFAAGKIHRGQELISASGVSKEKTLLIGDTDHDLEVGQALGIDVLLIADGHQHVERLVKAHNQVLKSRFK